FRHAVLAAQLSQHLALDHRENLPFLYLLTMMTLHRGNYSGQAGHYLHNVMFIKDNFARQGEAGLDDRWSGSAYFDADAFQHLVRHPDSCLDLTIFPPDDFTLPFGGNHAVKRMWFLHN